MAMPFFVTQPLPPLQIDSRLLACLSVINDKRIHFLWRKPYKAVIYLQDSRLLFPNGVTFTSTNNEYAGGVRSRRGIGYDGLGIRSNCQRIHQVAVTHARSFLKRLQDTQTQQRCH